MLRVRNSAEFELETEEHLRAATIQVRQRGTLTLPAQLRKKYGLQPGDTYRLVDLNGTMVLTSMVPMVPELAREIERMRLEACLSIEELLVSLREQRERYHVERPAAGQPEAERLKTAKRDGYILCKPFA
jgi:bifunctional DNA-binding transcriptional regulator/antitoxin component of YhaV-PrlF toxin-antitoxin module